MANQFSIEPANAFQALMSGVQGYDRGKAGVAEDEMKAGRAEAMQALQSGGDLRSPLAKLIGIGDVKGAAVIADFAKNQAEGQGVFGTPIMLEQPGGGYKVGAIGKQGQGRIINFGEGNSPTVPSKSVDTGTGTVIIPGRVSGAQPQGAPGGPTIPGAPSGSAVPSQGYFPKDVAGEAREKKYGAEVGDRQADLGKAKAGLDTNLGNLDRMAQQANELLTHKGLGRITGMVGMLPDIPGFPGADAQAKLQTLQAQSGFATLQAMRDASKTGGALGAVTEGEHKLLQSYLAELTRAQSEGQMKAALGKIKDFTEGAKDRLRSAYDQDYANIPRPNPSAQPTTNTQQPQPSAPRVGEARDGYRYKGGNPADPSSWVQMK